MVKSSVILQEAPLGEENWPALNEVTDSPVIQNNKKQTQMKPVTAPALSNNSNGNQSNSDSGGDDSSKENKENTNMSSNEEGQRTPKKRGTFYYALYQTKRGLNEPEQGF